MRTAAATLLGALLAVIALTTAPRASARATRIATDPGVSATRRDRRRRIVTSVKSSIGSLTR